MVSMEYENLYLKFPSQECSFNCYSAVGVGPYNIPTEIEYSRTFNKEGTLKFTHKGHLSYVLN